jgi:hypothetical protein
VARWYLAAYLNPWYIDLHKEVPESIAMKNLPTQLAAVVATVLLLVVPMSNAAETESASSGFLDPGVEAKLQKTKLASGAEVKLWKSSELNGKNYHAIMVDRVTFYPAPNPGPQVSSSTLDSIVDYMTSDLRKKVGAQIKVVDKAGPGVLRLQAVLTSVVTKKEGLSAKDIIPVHLLFSAASAASGHMNMDVTTHLEVRVTDSMSGEYRAAVKREITGEKLKNSEAQVKLENLQKSMDSATSDGAATLSGALD